MQKPSLDPSVSTPAPTSDSAGLEAFTQPGDIWANALQLAAAQRQQGLLSDATLDTFAAQLFPLLDAAAQQRLDAMLRAIKDGAIEDAMP